MVTKLFKRNFHYQLVILISTLVLYVNTCLWVPAAWAWDSASWNPTRPTHTLLTKWAIDEIKSEAPQFQVYQQQIIEGANTELHELPVSGTKYGIDLNAKRIEHKGTNEGSDDVRGWWQDSVEAYKKDNKEQAYFLLGVVLHMVEDMGVPAHANKVYHQGNLTQFDNFEALALSNWKPEYSKDEINRSDPQYLEPWEYYNFSEEWTRADAPDYQDRDSFAKFWSSKLIIRGATDSEKSLLSNRQRRTANLVKWTLNSAAKTLK